MILTISIEKERPGTYLARAERGGVLVTEPSTYDRIDIAIREQALNVPPGFAYFIEFTYDGMSSGTYLLSEVPNKASELADRLVALLAEMHRIVEGSDH